MKEYVKPNNVPIARLRCVASPTISARLIDIATNSSPLNAGRAPANHYERVMP